MTDENRRILYIYDLETLENIADMDIDIGGFVEFASFAMTTKIRRQTTMPPADQIVDLGRPHTGMGTGAMDEHHIRFLYRMWP